MCPNGHPTYFPLGVGYFCHLVPGQNLFGSRFGPSFLA